MIGLTTEAFDLFGHEFLKEDPQSITSELTRRVRRTATLDGNASISDLGFAVGDLTFKLFFSDLHSSVITNLERLIMVHANFRVSVRGGIYQCKMSALNTSRSPVEMTLLISKKLSQ